MFWLLCTLNNTFVLVGLYHFDKCIIKSTRCTFKSTLVFNTFLLIVDIYNKIQEEIKRQRIDKTALSKQLGISRNTVYNLNESTSIGTIFKIIEALGKTPCEFLLDEPKKVTAYAANNMSVSALSQIHEEAVMYGEIDYKEKYFETLEKLNAGNEHLLSFIDIKKNSTKVKK